jgi:hypothetical protein
MVKTVAVVSMSVLALAAAVKFQGLHHAPEPRAISAAQPTASAKEAGTAEPAKLVSHREQIARLVAETAAATADQTARRVLAKKSAVQQTALR